MLLRLFSVIRFPISASSYPSCSAVFFRRQPLPQQCFVLSFLSDLVTFIDSQLLSFSPSCSFRAVLWPLLTSHCKSCFNHGLYSFFTPHVSENSTGKHMHFHSMSLPHLLQLIPGSFWTSTCIAVLSSPAALCDFCSSGQSFAFHFLQIPPRGGHPCGSAIIFPLPGDFGTFAL